jgi:hypothetical protein
MPTNPLEALAYMVRKTRGTLLNERKEMKITLKFGTNEHCNSACAQCYPYEY